MNASAAYALSLLELSSEYDCESEVYDAVVVLQNALSEFPSYIQIISSPAVLIEERKRLILELLNGAPALLTKTILTACERNEANLFTEILDGYVEAYHQRHGIISVLAVSAIPLSDKMFSQLEQLLKEATHKEILLKNRVDASCIGGLRIQMEGFQYDGSLQRKLQDIQQMLIE
ncbi:ATP synthase F1 subunit delta [Scatolibacter rhodanostii]|uniref:ATP synthase F1 subunit delta n=1 Tax=Scatolibacter rhodanostii TaxID=2014781 RepID=UPI0013566698|nr:ATP synthase F1 subunit delta [Scatolibacter rhodanostii]